MLLTIFYIIVLFLLIVYAYLALSIKIRAPRHTIIKTINSQTRLPDYSFVDKKYIDEFNSLLKIIENEIRENRKINSLQNSVFQNYVELQAIVTIFKSFGDIDAYHNQLNTYLKENLIAHQRLWKLYENS